MIASAAAALSLTACGGPISVPSGGGTVSGTTTASSTASASASATSTATDDPTNTPGGTGTVTLEPTDTDTYTDTASATASDTTSASPTSDPTNTPAGSGSAVQGTGTYEVGEATVPELDPGVYTSTGPATPGGRCTFVVLSSAGGTTIASGASSGEALRVTLTDGQVFLTRGCAPWVAEDGSV